MPHNMLSEEEISAISQKIIISPETHINLISDLLTYKSDTILIKILQIYKQLIPLYKIKIMDDQVKTHSKEYSALKEYDKKFIQQYSKFVKEIIKNKNIGYYVAAVLLSEYDHFNFTEKMIMKVLDGTKIKCNKNDKQNNNNNIFNNTNIMENQENKESNMSIVENNTTTKDMTDENAITDKNSITNENTMNNENIIAGKNTITDNNIIPTITDNNHTTINTKINIDINELKKIINNPNIKMNELNIFSTLPISLIAEFCTTTIKNKLEDKNNIYITHKILNFMYNLNFMPSLLDYTYNFTFELQAKEKNFYEEIISEIKAMKNKIDNKNMLNEIKEKIRIYIKNECECKGDGCKECKNIECKCFKGCKNCYKYKLIDHRSKIVNKKNITEDYNVMEEKNSLNLFQEIKYLLKFLEKKKNMEEIMKRKLYKEEGKMTDREKINIEKNCIDALIRIYILILRKQKKEYYTYALVGIRKYNTFIKKDLIEGINYMLTQMTNTNNCNLLLNILLTLYSISDTNVDNKTVINHLHSIFNDNNNILIFLTPNDMKLIIFLIKKCFLEEIQPKDSLLK
ncbi:hypothetical protein SLOPH_1658, partial [Spraguea lophii 42_110]